MNVLVLLAGESIEFFNHGMLYPKYLTEICGKPLVEHVINSLNFQDNVNFHFVILKEDADKFHLHNVIKLIKRNANIIIVDGPTKGAACSVLLAIEYINNEFPLFIINGDQILDIDYQIVTESFSNKELDGGIIIFDSIHPRWSYVKLDKDHYVIETAEKNPISRNATAGVYYFRQGKLFVDSAMEMIEKDANVNGLYYVCPSYNELILKHYKIGVYNIDREQYISAASPKDIAAFTKHLENRVK